MTNAITLLGAASITENITTIGCTGGGAHKYASEFEEKLDIRFVQQDELQSLVRGMHYALTNFYGECYTYRFEENEHLGNQTGVNPFSRAASSCVQQEAPPSSSSSSGAGSPGRRVGVKEYTQKVMIPYENVMSSNPFPYLVVNIGSGVSILKVRAPNDFERVSGSAIGGGTYWGLCRLLTKCTSYENAIDLSGRIIFSF